MMKLPFINRIFPSYRSRIVAVIIGGIIVGGGALFMYTLIPQQFYFLKV